MVDQTGWFSNETATFGDRLAAAREASSLGQADLARKLGVKAKTVRGWEDDLTEPRANKLQMLSGLLGVSLMWMLTGEGDGLDAPELNAEMAQPDLKALLFEMREIRAEMTRSSDRLARVEKRLRATLNPEEAF
jgi:transcriptional regulator with XRE-family HTH domain